jgi:hypothetical protein
VFQADFISNIGCQYVGKYLKINFLDNLLIKYRNYPPSPKFTHESFNKNGSKFNRDVNCIKVDILAEKMVKEFKKMIKSFHEK